MRHALILLLVLLFALSPTMAFAAALDEIERYEITVDAREDGTLDMTYRIDWKVLDDQEQGPLTFVLLGVPNSHIDEITALSDCIESIRYQSADGHHLRIDLDRPYRAGEVASLGFSIHQARMYELTDEGCNYRFTPGWFDDIGVQALTIRWNARDVAQSDAQGAEGGYLVWRTVLSAGERYAVNVSYPPGALDASGEGEDDFEWGRLVSGLAFAAVFLALITFFLRRGGRYRGGFGGGRSAGFRSNCACACACAGCACACACAGGGRAGCAAKNFYGGGFQRKDLEGPLRSSMEDEPSLDRSKR